LRPLPLSASAYSKRKLSFDLEDLMSDRMFDSPVFVRSGNSLIALEFLYEWPKNRRGIIYETALRVCQRAFDSNYPLNAARQAFCGFAKSAGILEEVSIPLPWMTDGKAGASGLGA
jgi:hypothetical protein